MATPWMRGERTMGLIASSTLSLDRRSFLRGSSALALAAASSGTASAAPVDTKARIVIAGGGAAGLTVASRLARRLNGAEIVMVEPRAEHNYQPGYTLVGAGLKPASYVKLATADFVPSGVRWVRENIVEFEPVGNKVVTDKNTTLPYDFLVIATGLALDYDAIEGMSRDLIGREGIASVYAGPEQAAASWAVLAKFCETGGTGLFGRPATEMKCAGAPLKQTFLADDHLRRKSMRGKAEIVYMAHNPALFSVPKVDARVRELFTRQDITTNFSHVLTRIDPGKRIATFATPGGPVELKWDFINVIPPMRAPAAIRKSPLPWQSGGWAADGWIEVDKATLRHLRFANVFGVGDINGVPKGKTAASVKWQAPVAVDHLVGTITGKPGTETYNGYTSCPLITRIGQAMLVEFDYNDNLTPSFPFIDPLQEHWLAWVIKEKALKANYTAMLQGLA
jgi:sulfide:quinone oxidoreductase